MVRGEIGRRGDARGLRVGRARRRGAAAAETIGGVASRLSHEGAGNGAESGVESVAGGRFGWGVQVSPLRRPSASMSSVFLFLAPGGRPLLRFTGAASPGAGPRCAGRRLDAPCGCAGASFPSGCCSIPIWRRGGKAFEG